jgi:sulfonate dioxygenase
MQKYLESLTALHSADLQAQGSRDLGRTVRREPVTTEHPLIRTNPVTGWKSIFFNPGFVTKIVGVPKTESDHVIALLNEIVATSPEIHARFQWNEGDVAFWDNRATVSVVLLHVHGYLLTYCRTTLLHMDSHHTEDMPYVLL